MKWEEAIEQLENLLGHCESMANRDSHVWDADCQALKLAIAALKLAMLGSKEAAKRLTETGYFKASGDLALCRCPFCGSEDVVYERYLHTVGYRWRVVCTSCMASIDPGCAQQRSVVQRMWNTRAPVLSESEMEMLEGME